MSCQCYQIGGPFIAEDPDCPIHGREGREREQRFEAIEEDSRKLRASVRRLVGQLKTAKDDADKLSHDGQGGGPYTNDHYYNRGKKAAILWTISQLSALIDGKGQSEAPQEPIKYTGHPYCHKCGKIHWMYAECETTNPRER